MPAAKGKPKAASQARPRPKTKPAASKSSRPAATAKKAKPAKGAPAVVRPAAKKVALPVGKTIVVKSVPKSAPAPPPVAEIPRAVARPSATPKGDGDFSVAGQIYQRGKLVPAVLHIDTVSGRIVRIAKTTQLETHLDFGKRAILPGAIDIHVHFREPGHTHKEDILSGSTAAAFGGVTGYIDMPNTLPTTISLRTLKDKLATMARRSVVDYGAWAGGTWYTEELPKMLQYAAGVKTYLGASTGDLLLEDMERLRAIFTACATAGRPAVLHAESQRVLQQMRRNETMLADHDHTRPPLAEVEAIYDAMKAGVGLKKPPKVHIAHIASADAVQAATPSGFSMGVCPHHLLLDTDSSLTHAYGKMNPPLRSPASRQALWSLFAAGKIPILESDHAPHTKAEKEDSFHSAPSGVPGVETMVPLLLAQVQAGHVELARVVEAASMNPAKLLGATDRGELEAGMRADFAVYDLAHPTKVVAADLHSKCGWTPFAGHKAVFPSHTYLAGHPIVQEGELVAQPGTGRSILPQPRE